MSVRDDLIAARALIDTPEKWGKGQVSIFQKPLSVLGAIAYATGGGSRYRFARSAIIAQVPADLIVEESEASTLFFFNDDDDTTHDVVIAAFDRAISAQGGK